MLFANLTSKLCILEKNSKWLRKLLLFVADSTIFLTFHGNGDHGNSASAAQASQQSTEQHKSDLPPCRKSQESLETVRCCFFKINYNSFL